MSSQTSTTFIYTLESHHAIHHRFRLLSAFMGQVMAVIAAFFQNCVCQLFVCFAACHPQHQTVLHFCLLPRLPGVMLHLHDCRLSIMTLCHLCVSNTRATPGLVKKSWFVAKILQVWATEDIDIVIQICKYIHSVYIYI